MSYFRSGSSLLGDLLSLHPSSSYYFEPFFQHKIFGKCRHRFNSSDVVDLIEETVGGIVNCEGKVINNLSKFSIRRRSLQCNETNITVIKTIRIHLNGVIPWVLKNHSIKVDHHSVAFIFLILTWNLVDNSPGARPPISDPVQTPVSQFFSLWEEKYCRILQRIRRKVCCEHETRLKQSYIFHQMT